ncbi:MAG TPA: hypothetical protein VGP24_17320, partial [Glaciihabitans sp.]|nr:hypothetical protein [Glaciihabitans sp.]
ARVSYSLSTTGETWVNDSCPAAGVPARRIKVVSTGSAANDAVVGSSAGDEQVIETIFNYTPEVLPGVHPSGAAMYVHGGIVFDNNGDLLVAESGRAAIQVKNGGMTCANNTVIQGDVVVENGALDITACTIEGNAWASGIAKLGHITGNLSASNATRPAGVDGAYTRNGDIPDVPAWVDLAYVPGDWIDTNGLPYKVTPIGSDCALTPSMLASASNGTKPVIINALGCTGGVVAPSSVKLANDVVVFSPRFNFTSHVTFSSTSTAQHKLWFITPDNTPDNLPTCAATQGNFEMKNGFVIAPTIAAMLYTPCRFAAMNNFEWRGQLYANGANDFKNNTWFESVSLGLPGIDLDTGVVTPGGAAGSPAELGTVIFTRDVN